MEFNILDSNYFINDYNIAGIMNNTYLHNPQIEYKNNEIHNFDKKFYNINGYLVKNNLVNSNTFSQSSKNVGIMFFK